MPAAKLPSRDELHRQGGARTYRGHDLDLLAWPVGGLGTGAVILGGHGQVRALPGPAGATVFLALRAQSAGKPAAARVLQGPLPATKGAAATSVPASAGVAAALAALPHCAGVEFTHAFPFGQWRFQEPALPLQVLLEAYNPFIPLQADDASLPAACFLAQLSNPGRQPVTATLSATLARPRAAGAGASTPAVAFTQGGAQGLALAPAAGDAAPTFALASAWADPTVTLLPAEGGEDGGTLLLRATIPAGGTLTLPLWLLWHRAADAPRWADVAAVAAHLATHHARLEAGTRALAAVWHDLTLPEPLRALVAARLQAEKPLQTRASTTLPTFFPALDRALQEAHWQATASGAVVSLEEQLGRVLAFYRVWLGSDDPAWLPRLWPRLVAALEAARQQADPDGDGILEGAQSTSDGLVLHGPNTRIGSLYLAALRVMEELAFSLNDAGAAAHYRERYEKGRAYVEAVLFDGHYFTQQVWAPTPPVPAGQALPPPELIAVDHARYPASQYGGGCLTEQLAGQWFASACKLGDLVEAEMAQAALSSIWKHNWQAPRKSAARAAVGLRRCTWPHGGRPVAPLPGADDVRLGGTYQVAGSLIYAGLADLGLAILHGLHDPLTHGHADGDAASDLVQGGGAVDLLWALSDCFYSAPAQSLHVAPRLYAERFTGLLVVPTAWGLVRQGANEEGLEAAIELRGGTLTLANWSLGVIAAGAKLTLAGEPVAGWGEIHERGTIIHFEQPVTLNAGQTLLAQLAIEQVDGEGDGNDALDPEDVVGPFDLRAE